MPSSTRFKSNGRKTKNGNKAGFWIAVTLVVLIGIFVYVKVTGSNQGQRISGQSSKGIANPQSVLPNVNQSSSGGAASGGAPGGSSGGSSVSSIFGRRKPAPLNQFERPNYPYVQIASPESQSHPMTNPSSVVQSSSGGQTSGGAQTASSGSNPQSQSFSSSAGSGGGGRARFIHMSSAPPGGP